MSPPLSISDIREQIINAALEVLTQLVEHGERDIGAALVVDVGERGAGNPCVPRHFADLNKPAAEDSRKFIVNHTNHLFFSPLFLFNVLDILLLVLYI